MKQHFLALPSLLENARLTAIVPRPLARSLARIHPLSTHESPYKTTSVEVGVLWHERNTADPPQEWLRAMLKRASEHLRARFVELADPARPASAAPFRRIAARA